MPPSLLTDLPDAQQEQLRQASFPKGWSPMLATLTEDYFSDPDWIYERKLDGERALIYLRNGKVKLRSRNDQDLNPKYPELVEALEAGQGPDLVADGEIVAFANGKSSFSALQPRMQNDDPSPDELESTPVFLYLFDLLYLSGYDLTDLPLRTRKSLLKQALPFRDPVRYVQHRNEEGEAYHEEACRKGWEGIIAKDATSTYVHSRSRKWLKFKCVNRQELVIGGYTDPQGERVGFGALLLGFFENDQLQYAGKVGTGFDDALLRSLHDRMKKLERKTSPFAQEVPGKEPHWITPELVAEIGFTEWTADHKLRHPRFLGLREDKEAKAVHRERPRA